MTEFDTEAELCQAFIGALPECWTSYNETAGFDMLLVHDSGFQIGVEAKLRLNAKVVCQAAETGYRRGVMPGPDARAVLVPVGSNSDIARICEMLSVTVVTLRRTPDWDRKNRGEWTIDPALPEAQRVVGADEEIDTVLRLFWANAVWHDLCPTERARLPEYIPDVPAGCPSPVVLGHWKI